MAVNTGTWFLETTGDGSTTSFLCAFPVMRLADIWVYVDDVLQTANRDYSITGAVKNDRNSIDAGWSVVFTEAPASGVTVYIRRKTPRHNSNKLYKGDKFSLPVFENNYDNITMMYQELGGLIIDGYQGPIAENIPPQNYNPTLSGFYPCKIVGGPTSNQYVIRSVVPTPEGGWNTVSYPVLDETAADINNRTNYSLNDIVLAKPIADSSGDVAWRFVGNEDCASTAEPPYSGTYYEVARCDNLTVDEVAWVRSDEFSTGQSFVRYGVCYSVLGSGTPPLNSLVIRASEVTTYSNCTNCTTANPNSPDTETPPFPASRYKKMANCTDDSTNEYSIPVEFFGVPTNHDLTKIYKTGGNCYYVSDEEEASLSNPLIPTQENDVYNSCEDCLPKPCTDCNPSGVGAAPSSAIVSNILGTSGCTALNSTAPFLRFADNPGALNNVCVWDWDLGGVNGVLSVFYVRVAQTIGSGGCATACLAGDWLVDIQLYTTGDQWLEKTTGFSCSPTSGKVSGFHQFVAANCKVVSCSGLPSVLVPA